MADDIMRTLRQRVEEEGPLDVRDALGWLTRAVKTIARIHDQGRVHGNICADAIVTSSRSCDGDGTLVHPDDVSCPTAYFAPDREAGADAAAHHDVWALAVTLYHLLTGSLPYPKGVARWRTAGNSSAPNIAVYDNALSTMQLLIEEVLKPTASPESLPSAAILKVQLAAFSPTTADLARLPLAAPLSGLPRRDDDMDEVQVTIMSDVPEDDAPPVPLLSSLPPAPMRPPPPPRLPRVRAREPNYRAYFLVTLCLFMVTLGVLVVVLVR